MYDALRTIHVMCFFFRSRVIHHHQLLSRAVVAFVSSVTSRACVKLFWALVNFPIITTKNCPLCVIRRIQASVFFW